MSQDNVDIIINNKYSGKIDRREALGTIIGLCMRHLEYMSTDAMKEWILESCSLIEETLEWKNNVTIKKKINRIRDYFTITPDIDRETMMTVTTNMILGSEGLGILVR